MVGAYIHFMRIEIKDGEKTPQHTATRHSAVFKLGGRLTDQNRREKLCGRNPKLM